MIFLACILTLLIEVPFLAVFGYRSRNDLTITVCINVVTNLLLNLLILLLLDGQPGGWIYLMESFVVAVEYAVYSYAFGRGKRLFLLTLSANCLSFFIGRILFGFFTTFHYI